MLTTDDKKEIRLIVKGELKPLQVKIKGVQDQIEGVRGSVIKISGAFLRIEKGRKILLDIWEFIKNHTHQLKDHEERITELESASKF